MRYVVKKNRRGNIWLFPRPYGELVSMIEVDYAALNTGLIVQTLDFCDLEIYSLEVSRKVDYYMLCLVV